MTLVFAAALALGYLLSRKQQRGPPRAEWGKTVVIKKGACKTVSQKGGFVVYHRCKYNPREIDE